MFGAFADMMLMWQLVFSPFFTLPSDRREANNEDGPFGVLAMLSHCGIEFGNLSDSILSKLEW